MIYIIGLTLFDMIATYIGVTTGNMTEGNILMKGLIDNIGLIGTVILSGVLTGLCLVVIALNWRLRIARIGFYFIGLVKGLVAGLHIIWITGAML